MLLAPSSILTPAILVLYLCPRAKNAYGRYNASWIKENIFPSPRLQFCETVSTMDIFCTLIEVWLLVYIHAYIYTLPSKQMMCQYNTGFMYMKKKTWFKHYECNVSN